MAYGIATRHRLTSLDVVADGDEVADEDEEGEPLLQWTMLNTMALTVACPCLQSLALNNVHISRGTLVPLRQLTNLTQLLIDFHSQTPNVLEGLAGVTSLKYLSMTPPYADPAISPATFPFQYLSALAPLTQLTRLVLPALAAPTLAAATATASPPDAAAVAALAGLINLHSLQLSMEHFVVNDAVFAALQQLTRLTYLEVCRVQLSAPPVTVWAQLEAFEFAENLLPTQLLETLSPMMPSLTSASLGSTLHLSVRHLNPGTGAAELVSERSAMEQLCALLAASPHIEWLKLSVSEYFGNLATEASPPFAEALQLMVSSKSMSSLELRDDSMTVPMVLDIAKHLPNLKALRIVDSRADDAVLWAISSHLTGLESLFLGSTDDRPSGITITSGGWIALASAPRRQCLTLKGNVCHAASSVWGPAQRRAHGDVVWLRLPHYN